MVLTRLEEPFVFFSNQLGIYGLRVQRQLHMEVSQLHYNSRLYTKMAPGFVRVTSHENALSLSLSLSLYLYIYICRTFKPFPYTSRMKRGGAGCFQIRNSAFFARKSSCISVKLRINPYTWRHWLGHLAYEVTDAALTLGRPGSLELNYDYDIWSHHAGTNQQYG